MRTVGMWMGLARVVGCATEEVAEVVPPEIVSFHLEPAVGVAGDSVVATVEVDHFEFSGGEHVHDDDGGSEPSGDEHEHEHEHDGDEAVLVGHVHLYLDDLMTNPLAMQTESVGTFEIPLDADLGQHVIMARLHDSSHLIIEPQVIAEHDLEVVVP